VIIILLLIESLIERIEYIELKWVGGEREMQDVTGI